MWLVPSPVALPLQHGVRHLLTFQLQCSKYSLNGKCPFLEWLLQIILEPSTISVQSIQVQDQLLIPESIFNGGPKFFLVNSSFKAACATAEDHTTLHLLSSFTSSLWSSNSSSRTCKLPEINEYHTFHQAHAPWPFQCLKHMIVSKL